MKMSKTRITPKLFPAYTNAGLATKSSSLKMRRFLSKIGEIKHQACQLGRAWTDGSFRERSRLAKMPRYIETTTDLPGFVFRIPDAASFLASWDEIFGRDIYNFHHPGETPRILDCGANVGVSCLYFLRRFSSPRITAFEPDPKIFSYLNENLAISGAKNVEIINKGVWSSNTTLRFQAEGADAGRIDIIAGSNAIEIQTVRLKEYLNETVDLLKMDIEGAETEVILDSVPCLRNVKNIFVEYHSFAGQPQTLGKLIQALIESGFRIHLHPMRVSARPLIEVDSHLGMDMQLNVFGYRSQSKE